MSRPKPVDGYSTEQLRQVSLRIPERGRVVVSALALMRGCSRAAVIEPVVVSWAETRRPYAIECAARMLEDIGALISGESIEARAPDKVFEDKNLADQEPMIQIGIRIPQSSFEVFRAIKIADGPSFNRQLAPVVTAYTEEHVADAAQFYGDMALRIMNGPMAV